jgi:hypothetical protein
MATANELIAARAAAGSRYADAVTELLAAMTDLAAYDLALMNRNIPIGIDDRPKGSFQVSTGELRLALKHPTYVPLSTFKPANYQDAAQWQSDVYIASYTPS